MTQQSQTQSEALARKFHETYERLAPSFGYETRPETKAFDPNSPNGKLMIAVCNEIASTPAAAPVGLREVCRECGSEALSWFAHNQNRSQVVEGRLKTNDVECVFVLGCDACSETLRIVTANEIAARMTTTLTPPAQEVEAPARTEEGFPEGCPSCGALPCDWVDDPFAATPADAAPAGSLRAALQEAHDTLHECTAVLSASDCEKVAAVMEKCRAAIADAASAGEVAIVMIEPDYWCRGHFYKGSRKATELLEGFHNLPVGTKLYAHPPQPSGQAMQMREALERLVNARKAQDEWPANDSTKAFDRMLAEVEAATANALAALSSDGGE